MNERVPPITPYERLDALEADVRTLRAKMEAFEKREQQRAALLSPQFVGAGDPPSGAGGGTLHLPKGKH